MPKTWLALFFVLCSWPFAITPAQSQELRSTYYLRQFEAVIGICGDPCVIRDNRGGIQSQFEKAADALLSGEVKHLVIIDGVCASACAVFAERASKDVCITYNVAFAFHMALSFERSALISVIQNDNVIPDGIAYTLAEPRQGRAIKEWVYQHGGFPNSLVKPLFMQWPDAQKFWRFCAKKERAAAGLP